MLAVKGKGHVPQQGAAVDAGDQRRAVQGIEDLAADGQELAQGRGIGLAPGGILLRPLGVFLHQQVHQGRSQAKAAPYLHTAAHVHDGDGGDHVGQAAAAGHRHPHTARPMQHRGQVKHRTAHGPGGSFRQLPARHLGGQQVQIPAPAAHGKP